MSDTDAADELTVGLNSLHIAQYRGLSPPPAEPPKTFSDLDTDAVELIVRLLPSCYDVARVAGANRALRDAAPNTAMHSSRVASDTQASSLVLCVCQLKISSLLCPTLRWKWLGEQQRQAPRRQGQRCCQSSGASRGSDEA